MSAAAASHVNLSRLGLTLKLIREEKNISIEQVAQGTRIKQSYLQAIDSEQFTALPRGPYEAAFIKAYADYLDLDGAAFAKAYQGNHKYRDMPLPYQSILTQSRYNRSPIRAWLSLFLFVTILVTYALVFLLGAASEKSARQAEPETYSVDEQVGPPDG